MPAEPAIGSLQAGKTWFPIIDLVVPRLPPIIAEAWLFAVLKPPPPTNDLDPDEIFDCPPTIEEISPDEVLLIPAPIKLAFPLATFGNVVGESMA